MGMTNLILEYCRKADARNAPKMHANWCELETGLWHTCDCCLGWHREELANLLWIITNFRSTSEGKGK